MAYEKNLEIGALNELYGGLLTARQREFIRLYYDCDVSLREMGEMSGISPQAVRDAIRRGERELFRIETALKFDEKRAEISKILAKYGGEIKKEIEEILY
ncbi:MAG: DNA-binding protein [Clostridiales bacterium]|jgi:predicted DNA-binding protein YlxM (UPF0122 family)|nr:DNA-binding protein [Clostridiales bacterium]